MMLSIETVLAPDLFKFHSKLPNVVLIDVARFTTTMVTALANGAACVEAYPDTETPLRLKRERGYLIAGERLGNDIEGYDFNNSPLAMTRGNVEGRHLAFCTSNGTYARSVAGCCEGVFAASFLNCKAVCRRLASEAKPVTLLCSGRSRKPATEDILLAGKIAGCLEGTGNFCAGDESTNMAMLLYGLAKNDIKSFVLGMYPLMADYARKYPQFGRDIDFAFGNHDIYDIVPKEAEPFKFCALA